MKILGVGNALVDVLAPLSSDEMLERLGLSKGGMRLINDDEERRMSKIMSQLTHERATGGSASNAILALSHLQSGVGFVGNVGDDRNGRFFADTLARVGVEGRLTKEDKPTGTANTFITPDGERTFATYLGAAACMRPEHITGALFAGYDMVHVEGYLVGVPGLLEKVLRTAKETGLRISVDLSSYNVVQAYLEEMHDLVENYVDIVFANEEEAEAFTGEKDPLLAARQIAELCELAVVKMGSAGSGVMQKTVCREPVTVASHHVEVVDTTAAGDFFAAGFLYGCGKDLPLRECLQCGTELATAVIQVIGTRVTDEAWASLQRYMNA